MFGERRFGTRYRSAIEATDLDYQTLRNYAWVARNVDAGRRREELSFQHHAEVAVPARTRAGPVAAPRRHARLVAQRAAPADAGAAARRARGGADRPRGEVSSDVADRWRRAAEVADQDLLEGCARSRPRRPTRRSSVGGEGSPRDAGRPLKRWWVPPAGDTTGLVTRCGDRASCRSRSG